MAFQGVDPPGPALLLPGAANHHQADPHTQALPFLRTIYKKNRKQKNHRKKRNQNNHKKNRDQMFGV